MVENQKMDEVTANSVAAAQPAFEMSRRDWVTPQFECIPLTEAMGSGVPTLATDSAGLYS